MARTAVDNVGTANACVQRVAELCTSLPTLADAEDQVSHPLANLTKEDLKQVVAALAARVVYLEEGAEKRAQLAFQQVVSIVARYTEDLR